MLASAGASIGYQRFGDGYYFVKHQLMIGLIPGLAACYVMSKIPYHFWKRWSTVFLAISVLSLLLVFIPGLAANYGTARSWIVIGGFSFQPAELVKLTFLLYLAAWFDQAGKEKIRRFTHGFLPFIFLLGIILGLILLQPDMGTMVIIALEMVLVYFLAGGHLAHLGLIGVFGAGLLYIMIKFSPYRADRFMTFLHPELDPRGIGYHINQAFLAIGTGGWLGQGYGQSRQKLQFLPEVTADSIFAVIGEELGFLIGAGIIAVFVYLFIRGARIADKAPDEYGRLLVMGIIGWITIQSIVNIGAMVGLLPLTGVPLPFISAGGTSMFVTLAAVGLVLNISRFGNGKKSIRAN